MTFGTYDSKERIFFEAQAKAEADAKTAELEWSDRISPELAAVFTALDALDAPVKSAGVAEALYEEFELWGEPEDKCWLSEEARTVKELNAKFQAAHTAYWKKCLDRTAQLNAEEAA